MSLDFKLPDTDEFRASEYGWQDTLDGPRVHPATQTIVFATMSTGIGLITRSNADEFYARMTIVNKLHGIGIIEVGNDTITRDITMEEVQAHIGLSTNVSGETRAQWAKRLFVGAGRANPSYMDVSITSDFARQYRRWVSQQGEAALKAMGENTAKDTVAD